MAHPTQRGWLYLSIAGVLAGCGPRVDATEGVAGEAISMTTCSPITASGSYVLTQDLSSADFTTCLDVHDTSNVQIECGGHSVSGMGTAIAVTHVTGFAVANCTVRNQINEVPALSVAQSSNGTFTHDAILPVDSTSSYALMSVLDSNAITVTNSMFTGFFGQNYTSGTTFASNVMASHAHDIVYVASNYGHNNQITDNDIDGNGLADDAILIADESQDQIRNNHVRNVYDAGIETLGVITSTIIDGNTIDAAALTGIGGYWFTGLASTTISNNTITNSDLAINFFRSCGLRPAGFDTEHKEPAESAIVFRDNRFVGNHFVPASPDRPAAAMPVYSIFSGGAYGNLYLSGIGLGPTSICAEVDHLVEPTAASFQLTNNFFAGNDFGVSEDRPYFGEPAVPGRIVDGGGNVCGGSMFSPGGDYPLDCGQSVQGSASIAGSNAPGCIASFDGEATLASLGVAKAGGVVTVQVGTNGGCAFGAASPVSWIRLAEPSAGQLQLIVDPNPGVVRLAVLTIGDRRFGVIEEGQSGMFSDVPYGDTSAFYVYTLSTRGIWPGVGNGAYGRDALVVRQEMAAIVARARYGIGVAGPADPYFSDVPTYNPYFAETQKLMQCEIVTGTSKPSPTALGTFNPGDNLTREQMAAFIIRAALGGYVCDYDRTSDVDYMRPNPNDGFMYPSIPEFTDVIDGPYFPFVQEMGALHITSGCSSSPAMYCPATNIPHWQLAVFAARGLLGAP